MEYINYTPDTLAQFIASEKFKSLITIPITKHRALSHIHNPRASENDILLCVAYDNNQIAGYLGVLPDTFFFGQSAKKFGWLSCFWVDEHYKSQQVATALFLRISRAWKQHILITNIVPSLEQVYQETGIFKPTLFKIGLRGYMRFSLHEILPPKKIIFTKVIPLLKVIDAAGNIFSDLRLPLLNYKSASVSHTYITEIDKETTDYIVGKNTNELTKRGKAELDWITTNPWVLSGNKNDLNGQHYYFSAFSTRATYLKIKFLNTKNEIVGFALLFLRNNSLTIPYFYGNPEHLDEITKIIYAILIPLKVNMFTTFNNQLITAITNSKHPFLFTKKIKRPYLISQQFDSLTELQFQDGDGDCCFT